MSAWYCKIARLSEVMSELQVLLKIFGLPFSFFKAEVSPYLLGDTDMKQIQAVALMLVFCQFSTVKIAVEIILSVWIKREYPVFYLENHQMLLLQITAYDVFCSSLSICASFLVCLTLLKSHSSKWPVVGLCWSIQADEWHYCIHRCASSSAELPGICISPQKCSSGGALCDGADGGSLLCCGRSGS